MKRTSSGNEIEKLLTQGLHAAPELAPYIYMPANDETSESLERRRILFHGGGGVCRPRAGTVFTLPWFKAEVSQRNLTATTQWWPRIIFVLPLSCISRAAIRLPVGEYLNLWSAMGCCCCGAKAEVLELELDAPAGWLHHSPTGGAASAGRITLALFVRDVEAWVDAMGLGDRLIGRR